MGFRITNSILYRTTLGNVDRQRMRLVDLQEKAASGLKINRPSDDPAGVRTATVLRSALQVNEQYGRNVVQARTRVARVESAISTTRDLLIRVRELALQGASETVGEEAARDLSKEVEQLHGSILGEANTRVNGSFIFSGYASDTAPFDWVGPFPPAPPAPGVTFAGDANEISTAVDEGVSVTVSLNGQRVFMGDGDGDNLPDAGREDIFDVVSDVRDALLAPASQRSDALRATLDRIDTALTQLSTEQNTIGAVDSQLRRQEDLLSEREIQLTENLSDTQDADAAEVFSGLVNQENALRASLEATARVIQPSLLTFLG